MRKLALALLIAPLAFGACKKKEPEPAAAPAPAPAPAAPKLLWAWDDATFAGPRGDDTEGTLKIVGSVENNSGGSITVKALALGILDGAGGDICKAKGQPDVTAADGTKATLMLEIPCAYARIPGGDTLTIGGSAIVNIEGEDKTRKIEGKVTFNR
jgi:hypothetical protein